MPGKIARSAPRPSFGLPELLLAIHTSRQSCCKAGKARTLMLVLDSSGESRIIRPDSGRHSRMLGGLHLGYSGSDAPDTMVRGCP